MIESLNNEKIKFAFKLKQKKYRQSTGLFLVEGEHLVEEAIKSNHAKQIFTTKMDTDYTVETFVVSSEVMKKLSELGESQGVIALCEKPDKHEWCDHVLILDQIQDPGNMGTLIRSAAAFGFATIISEDSVDYYNQKVIRASQGAIFYVDLLEMDISELIQRHPEYHFIGTDVLMGLDLQDADLSFDKLAIILGNEGSGVGDEIKSLVNTNINIPMLSTESLNVGVAGGIIMYEAFRRK